MPEISVVIPSYNHAAYIGQAVESVFVQTHADFELIVVDDGSTDNSLEVLAGFTDARLRVLTQPNQGAHAAINRGLRESSGAYLAILNSDDLYSPERLAKALEVLKSDSQIGLVGSYIEIIDQEGKNLGVKHGYADASPWLLEAPERSFRAGNDLHKALLTENFWSTTSNFVFARQWYEAIGEFRPLRYAHDWDFALRMAKAARLELLPHELMRYRVHPSNTIRENRAAMIFEICWCLAVHLPQHLSDPAFIDLSAGATVDQLLNSIYTFSLERVLNVMLLQRLAENQPLALDLLEPDNLVRGSYLTFIQRELEKALPVPPASQPVNQPSFLTQALSKLRRKA